MSAVVQWLVVLAIVAVCAAYAVQVLLPTGMRSRLASRLRARGWHSAAGAVAAGTGCGACGPRACGPAPGRAGTHPPGDPSGR